MKVHTDSSCCFCGLSEYWRWRNCVWICAYPFNHGNIPLTWLQHRHTWNHPWRVARSTPRFSSDENSNFNLLLAWDTKKIAGVSAWCFFYGVEREFCRSDRSCLWCFPVVFVCESDQGKEKALKVLPPIQARAKVRVARPRRKKGRKTVMWLVGLVVLLHSSYFQYAYLSFPPMFFRSLFLSLSLYPSIYTHMQTMHVLYILMPRDKEVVALFSPYTTVAELVHRFVFQGGMGMMSTMGKGGKGGAKGAVPLGKQQCV